MEDKLLDDAEHHRVDKVKRILRNHPNIDVNWKNHTDILRSPSLLHCIYDRGDDAIISMLLAHPNIDVNLKESRGQIPFFGACQKGLTSAVRLFLHDPRVNVNDSEERGTTPLWSAAAAGHVDIIKWWIASGREMTLGKPGDKRADALGVAVGNGRSLVVSLLENFKANPDQTRADVMKELGITGERKLVLHLDSPKLTSFVE